jgi:hypothetical protein
MRTSNRLASRVAAVCGGVRGYKKTRIKKRTLPSTYPLSHFVARALTLAAAAKFLYSPHRLGSGRR